MAKKKAEQVGRGIGLIVSLVVVAALLAAAVLPLFLAFRYLKHYYLSFMLRKRHNLNGDSWRLTDEEKGVFKAAHASEIARLAKNMSEHASLEKQIAAEHQRAADGDVAKNMDGSYSRRSYLGKEIQDNLDDLYLYKSKLDLEGHEISCRQPLEYWDELNEFLKKKDVAFVALLGWAVGAFFFYSAYQEGAPFGIWHLAGSFRTRVMRWCRCWSCCHFLKKPRTQIFDQATLDYN